MFNFIPTLMLHQLSTYNSIDQIILYSLIKLTDSIFNINQIIMDQLLGQKDKKRV